MAKCHVFSNHFKNLRIHLHFKLQLAQKVFFFRIICDVMATCERHWHIEPHTEKLFLHKTLLSTFYSLAKMSTSTFPCRMHRICKYVRRMNSSLQHSLVANMMKNNFFICTINNVVNLELLKRNPFIVISHQRRCLCRRCRHHLRYIFDNFFHSVLFCADESARTCKRSVHVSCSAVIRLDICTATAKRSRNRKTF